MANEKCDQCGEVHGRMTTTDKDNGVAFYESVLKTSAELHKFATWMKTVDKDNLRPPPMSAQACVSLLAIAEQFGRLGFPLHRALVGDLRRWAEEAEANVALTIALETAKHHRGGMAS